GLRLAIVTQSLDVEGLSHLAHDLSGCLSSLAHQLPERGRGRGWLDFSEQLRVEILSWSEDDEVAVAIRNAGERLDDRDTKLAGELFEADRVIERFLQPLG